MPKTGTENVQIQLETVRHHKDPQRNAYPIVAHHFGPIGGPERDPGSRPHQTELARYDDPVVAEIHRRLLDAAVRWTMEPCPKCGVELVGALENIGSIEGLPNSALLVKCPEKNCDFADGIHNVTFSFAPPEAPKPVYAQRHFEGSIEMTIPREKLPASVLAAIEQPYDEEEPRR